MTFTATPGSRLEKASLWLLLAFVFSIPLEDSIQFGVGRISKVLGVAALAVWLVSVFVKGRIRRPSAAVWIASAFMVWAGLSYFWSPFPTDSLKKAVTIAQMVGVVWLVWDQASGEGDVRTLMRAFVWGSLAAAMLTILAAASGSAWKGTRFASSNAGPDNTGALLAVAVIMAFYLFRVNRRPLCRLFYAGLIPMTVLGMLLTGTRTAIVALAVGGVVLLLDPRRLTPGWVGSLTALAAVAALVVALYVPADSFGRLSTTSSEISSGTLNGRTEYWKLSFKLFSHHPVQGVGSGTFLLLNPQFGLLGRPAHNAFLSVLSELGVVGLGLFVAPFAIAAWSLAYQDRDTRRGWLAIGLTWFVGANSLTWEARKITWFLLALALVQAATRHTRSPRTKVPDTELLNGGSRTLELAPVTVAPGNPAPF